MSSEKTSDKTTITVDREALKLIHRLAKNRGVSLYNYVSMLFKKIYEVSGESYCPIDMLSFMKYYKIILPLDPIPIPMNLLIMLIEDVDIDRYRDLARDLGHRVGVYMKKTVDLRDLIQDLYVLREMNLFKDARANIEGNSIRILLVGSVESDKGATLLRSFIEGLLEAYEIRDYKIEISRNIIDLWISL
ncbi:MAG: hypothetical protein ABWJ42_06130 [Sulfolobales archaeon]